MATITGSNENDTITGAASNDIINSGNGDDIVNGGAGSDSLNGGAGNDILDGGSGSDQLNGGSGNDTLIYNVSENYTAATKDVYTGASGTDTVVIQFTLAQWLDSATQTQIAAYLAHLSAVTNAKTGEVSNGSARVQPDVNTPSPQSFQCQPNSVYFQYLAQGEMATDTFRDKVTDADGGSSTATVTISNPGSYSHATLNLADFYL